ncbi:nitroreductase family protein [Vibrio vulnificus]|nr:nitroreductase family protein [Vibrio vulnificus]EJB5284159.1 nitroreductase family protein [Vibrio vulnificus]EJE8537618.1 nitroreductase family protein [Vibrio vulnificus]EKA7340918.1 nitroreductase family protein [Vibrio vulnificus]ELX4125057.1 nitroreductase family protein [Vibrio vulnificus]
MKAFIRKLLSVVFGEDFFFTLRNIYLIISNFMADFILFIKHSTVFSRGTVNKIECQIILDYHSVEKGLLFSKTKPRFAQHRIKSLNKNLLDPLIAEYYTRSQIRVALQVMCLYYELHERMDTIIEDYYPKSIYLKYRGILAEHYSDDFSGVISYNASCFYERVEELNFSRFSNSRKSIRQFTGERIAQFKIEQAIQLALNTPSVCNRQASRVYLVEDKSKIDKILDIQGGFTGYSTNVKQLLIVSVDRNYFYTVGERNQLFIDGGMFLMNLLYSLHYNGIAACPANWGKTIQEEKRLDSVVTIAESEKIICMIPIGVASDCFKVTLSKRRCLSEVFKKV